MLQKNSNVFENSHQKNENSYPSVQKYAQYFNDKVKHSEENKNS